MRSLSRAGHQHTASVAFRSGRGPAPGTATFDGSTGARRRAHRAAALAAAGGRGDAQQIGSNASEAGRAELAASGIHPELLRLSVGCEPVDDLLAALDEALS